MSYQRLYLNGKYLRLYRGRKRKTNRTGTAVMEMRYWEVGIGRFVFTFGRWSA